MSIKHLNSHITVRARTSYVMELGTSVSKCRRKRSTEIDALNRAVYGDVIPATNNAAFVYDPDILKCSCCGKRKHFEQFNCDKRYTWRRGRRSECKECQSRLNALDYSSRKKRHARSRGIAA